MKMRTIKLFLAACFLLVFATGIHAQEQGTKTYLPKFAIKTNPKTDKSSTGWYNPNSVTGFANVSTVVFSACTAITPMST